MKQADVKRLIQQVWDNWCEPEDKYGLTFGVFLYGWLGKNHPECLKFKC
jgi:hypothetical protein